jgi:hypothetical protein
MEAEKQQHQQRQHGEENHTDPQQNEIDGNILGGIFESHMGDTKGRQANEDKPAASQTGGVQDQNGQVDG